MTLFFLTSLFILGTLFGSFASVVIWRIRTGEGGIATGRSHCPKCHHVLGARDLFPIFSWVFLRGRCRFCQEKISPVYPLLELATGMLFMLSGYFFIDPTLIFTGNMMECMRLLLFLLVAFVTIVFVFYDILFMEIPDEVLIPVNILLFVLLFVTSIGVPLPLFRHFLPFQNDMFNHLLDIPLLNAMVGAFAIFAFFYLQIFISHGKWMGGGDLRIALFMGLVGGAKIALLGLFLSYLVGSVIGAGILLSTRNRNTEVPFGPYLALGLYISLFWYTPIVDWYTKLFVFS
ncbi:MAG: prepilin peptidase [Candidatus Gracilibacteria bacterium]|nr:prepilin peptidase [Candidatus Gracilibacteria bacterium]